ncbi:MAG: RsmE family RNA methyltransferase [bacterium]
MTIPRIYLPHLSPETERIVLDGEDFHYLTRVLRVSQGEELMAYGWDDAEARVIVEEIGRNYIAGRLLEVVSVPPCPVSITLLQAVLKEDAMDEAIKGAATLGVSVFQPVLAERSVPRLSGPDVQARRAERWQKIAVRASSLARVGKPMAVRNIVDFETSLSGAALNPHETAHWILCEKELGRNLVSELMSGPRSGAAIAIGPEGGFSEGERTKAESAGWTAVGMGRRILPASLAGLVATTLVLGYWGDLAPEKTAGLKSRPKTANEGTGTRTKRGSPRRRVPS